MESTVMNEESKDSANTKGLLIGGLALLLVGMAVFALSVLSYAYFFDEDKAMREKAANEGIGEIPGVTLAGTISFFLALTIIGGLMSAAGAGLTLAAILGRKEIRGAGVDTRKSP